MIFAHIIMEILTFKVPWKLKLLASLYVGILFFLLYQIGQNLGRPLVHFQFFFEELNKRPPLFLVKNVLN